MDENAASPPAPALGPGTKALLLPALVVGVALAAYHRTFDVPFIWDDYANIVDNQSLRSLWPPMWAMGTSRPVALLSFALNYAASGLGVAGWHAVNLVIHALSGLVVFGLVRRTLEAPALVDRFRGRSAWVALASAAAWVAHPLHTSAVTYVVHRYESLAGAFYLLTLYSFARSIVAARPLRWQLAAVAACLLGMATKEIVATAPIVVLLYDRCFFAAGFRDALRRRGAMHGALFAPWLLVLLLVSFAPHAKSQGFGFDDLRPLDYARSEVGAVVYYLRLSVWPFPLSIDYWDWPVARSLGEVAGSAALLALIVAAGVWSLRRAPVLAFVALAWLIVLAPTSSFLPLKNELVAERRMYVPLAFLVPAAVAALDLALRRLRGAHAALIAGVVAALLAATISRNAEFRDPERLFRGIVDRHPGNVRARYHLALHLSEHGRTDEALAEFQRALSDGPRCWACANNVGTLLARKGQMADAELAFAQAARLAPDDANFRANLASALMAEGKWVEALAAQRETVRLDPSVTQREKLARILATAPDARARDGAEAVAVAEGAAAASRATGATSLRLLETLAAAYAEAGRWDEARGVATELASESRRRNRAPVARTAETMLARFADHQPWREGPDGAPPAK